MFVALQQQSAGNGDAAQYHGIRASRVAVLMTRISLDYSSGCEHDVVGGRHSCSVAAAKGEGEGGVTEHEECGWLSHGRGGGGGPGQRLHLRMPSATILPAMVTLQRVSSSKRIKPDSFYRTCLPLSDSLSCCSWRWRL